MDKFVRWPDLQEAGFVAGMRLLLWAYRNIDRRAFNFFIFPVVCFYIAVSPVARQSSREYQVQLTKFAGGDGSKVGLAHVFRHFLSFSYAALDKLAIWANSALLESVEFVGRELLLDQIATGRGAVILSGHLGNIEICRSLSRANSRMKLNILVHTAHAEMFNKLLQEQEVKCELELIEVTEMSPGIAIRLLNSVENGELVAIMADRVPVLSNGKTVPAQFLGREASFSIGPYVLASLLKCPVYTLFCTKSSANNYQAVCKKFSDQIVLPRRNRELALVKYAQRYSNVLQEAALGTPKQWYNFYPFWDQ